MEFLVGSGIPTVVELLPHTAALPWGSRQWNSFCTLPHCSSWQWAVELLPCTASLPVCVCVCVCCSFVLVVTIVCVCVCVCVCVFVGVCVCVWCLRCLCLRCLFVTFIVWVGVGVCVCVCGVTASTKVVVHLAPAQVTCICVVPNVEVRV